MSEELKKQSEEVSVQPEVIQESEPQAEMPEDFVEPEGRSGKWGEPVKGEVEVEGKKVEVSYREKVIELPKRRQEETGIKRIRRRELLPPFPDGIFIENEEHNPLLEDYRKAGRKPKFQYPFWRYQKNLGMDPIYEFLTDGHFPSLGTWVHQMKTWRGDAERMIARHKREGMYMQEIFPEREYDIGGESLLSLFEKTPEGIKKIDRYGFRENNPNGTIPKDQMATFDLFCSPRKMWDGVYRNPVFVFGNKNPALRNYINSVFANKDAVKMINLQHSDEDPEENLTDAPEIILDGSQEYEKRMQVMLKYDSKDEIEKMEEQRRKDGVVVPKKYPTGINGLKVILNGMAIPENFEPRITCVRHPDIKPLRWCHSEVALVPTKRSLNVLFFETGDEDKPEE